LTRQPKAASDKGMPTEAAKPPPVPLSSSLVPFPCDGRTFQRMVESGAAWLETHIDLVNSLNVYPVPDGDTGTNMFLTMQAALREVATVSEDTISAVAQALAHGALMGARGNSGVILSQIWRGVAKKLDGLTRLGAEDWAQALHEGAVVAYKGVMRPVEGTILTVAREAADAAMAAAADRDDMMHVLERVVVQAAKALKRTPELLPVLKEAGVVDAGGQGLCYLFEGLLRHVRGQPTILEAGQRLESKLPEDEIPEGEYGYDLQFLIGGQDLPIDQIREKMLTLGDSVLVVGDAATVKVHIHSDDPGTILSYATTVGPLSDIVLENMQSQYQAFLAKRALRQEGVGAAVSPPPLSEVSTMAVVLGEGLREVFESLGAGAVVQGGQTMNPSTEELLTAISGLPTDQVVVLPNNPNVVLAAQQAQGMSDKQVIVVPTSSIPQGVSALVAFNYQSDLATNVDLMERAAAQVQTIEVTNAVRSVQINGLKVDKGQYIGLLNGELVEAGGSLPDVTESVLGRIDMQRYEIVTIYWGDTVTAQQAGELADWVRNQYPDKDVELVEGKQPHYQYIVSVE